MCLAPIVPEERSDPRDSRTEQHSEDLEVDVSPDDMLSVYKKHRAAQEERDYPRVMET
ncbi:MAG: hypothetical protein M3P34_08890 [Actinomycetota bacterium]|nr:hypothetical protein [Actinomycetota bacterium]